MFLNVHEKSSGYNHKEQSYVELLALVFCKTFNIAIGHGNI